MVDAVLEKGRSQHLSETIYRAKERTDQITKRVDQKRVTNTPSYVEGYKHEYFTDINSDPSTRRRGLEEQYDPDTPGLAPALATSALTRKAVLDRYGWGKRIWTDTHVTEIRREGGETILYRRAPVDNHVYLVLHERVVQDTSTLQLTEKLVVAPSELSLQRFLNPSAGTQAYAKT